MRLIIVLGVLLVALTGWIVWNNPERIDLDSAARADVDRQRARVRRRRRSNN